VRRPAPSYLMLFFGSPQLRAPHLDHVAGLQMARGFRPWATPSGVPFEIMSPARSD